MPLPVLFAFFVVIALPVAWLAFEFTDRRGVRIGFGIASLLAMFGIAVVAGETNRFNYNAWYGGASKALIDTTITEIEDGNLDRVVKVLRRLNLDYRPTYENRAHYDELVEAAVTEMRGEHDLTGSRWDASPFSPETWDGHWENDTGFWLVINSYGRSFKTVRSGRDMPEMSDIQVSDDHRELTFHEGNRFRHEMTLLNKYEARHVWREFDSGRIWDSETMHKLVRATPEMRAFTQQYGESASRDEE